MSEEKSRRIKFQESGGGWGNPLIGRVFDSDKDVPEDEWTNFIELVEQCKISKSGELEGQPPTDTSTFELRIEEDDRTIKLTGDMLRADNKLRSLIGFIRKHSHKEILK